MKTCLLFGDYSSDN